MATSIARCLRELQYATEVASIAAVLQDFLWARGLESFLYFDAAAPLARGPLIQNYDAGLVSRLDRTNVWRRDPLRFQARRQPQVWHAGVAAPTPEADELIWGPTAAAGYRHAISVPIYGPNGNCDVFTTLTTGRDWPKRQSNQIINDLVLITYNLAGFFRSGAPAGRQLQITQRERDCLEWTARGKTGWEIAQILGISARTVHFHLQNAMRKLGLHSKHQAALAALQAGVVSLAPTVDAETRLSQD